VAPGVPSDNIFAGGAKAIGPSMIVFCFDVSDAISDEEMKAVVGAATECLSDPDLVPQDGSIRIAALVYGDTVGAALDTLVVVTPESLKEVILPAIGGLVTDRIVPTTGADLTGALKAAGDLLIPVMGTDRHILIMGSGAADKRAGAVATCQSLGQDDIMVSAVAYGGDQIGADLLEGCALATGGYFGEGTEDLPGTCATALAYMLQVDLTGSPESADIPRGGEHSVTATMYRGGDPDVFPVEGSALTFEIIEGPNATNGAGATTDSLGQAIFTYQGDNGPGTDVIVIQGTHPGTGLALTDTVTATWINNAPDCDAGGPYPLTVDADTMMVTLDGSGSSDADGDTLHYMWSVDFEGGSLDDPTAVSPVLTLTGSSLCVDSLMVHLMVTDSYDSSSCTAVIQLDDMRAPVVEVRDEPFEIWPVNHKYISLTPDMFLEKVEDACGRPINLDSVDIVQVRSDEPEDHIGDGRTIQDIVIDCPGDLKVRAERMGGGNGRVYTITYRVTGENGEFTDAEVMAVVPHDNSGAGAIDDGDAGYTVTADCGDGD